MKVITINSDILGGTPCFSGMRVPVSTLFDHLKEGSSLKDFLADFPTVTREQAEEVLELAKADASSHAAYIGAR